MIKIKKILDFLKDYIAVFLIVPTILGGIWQLAMLGSISFIFIRFFSMTQLVQDGLLIILFFIFFGFMSSLFIIFYFILFIIEIFLNEIKLFRKLHIVVYKMNSRSLLTIILFLIIAIIPTALMIFFMQEKVHGKYDAYEDFPKRFFFISGLLVTSYIYIIQYLKKWTKNEMKRHMDLLYVSIAFTVFYCFVESLYLFNRDYMVPNQLVNIETFRKNAAKQNKVIDVDIQYINDKFIFVKLIEKKISKNVNDTINKKFKIYKFEDLVDSKTDLIESKNQTKKQKIKY